MFTAGLKTAHPIYDLLRKQTIQGTGFDFENIVIVPEDEAREERKAVHDKWYARVEFHYAQMADRDADTLGAELVSGEKTGTHGAVLPLHAEAPARKDRVTLIQLEAEYEAAKTTAAKATKAAASKLKVVPPQRTAEEATSE